MASAILSCPLRAPLASDVAPLAIAYRPPTATGAAALAQANCQLVNIAGDLVSCILTAMLADKFQNLTLPGVCALVQASRSCHLLRQLCCEVKTPIDAAVVESEYNSIEGDQNFNRQRFLLHALQKVGGRPAGLRMRLISEVQDGEIPEEDPADPFLLVYRDARLDYDRPVVLAIAKPQPSGSLLCIELSIRELLLLFSGHSKHAVFNAVPAMIGRKMVDKWTFQPKNDMKVSVWGTTDGKLALVGEDKLFADSLNPVAVSVTPACDDDKILTKGTSLSGKVVHRFEGTVVFSFPESTCSAFSTPMALDYPAHLISLLGCHEPVAAAVMPTSTGSMIAKSNAWLRERRKRSYDAGGLSVENVLAPGRRAAVRQADLELQRSAAEEELMEDGKYLPGHPMYDEIKAEVDEINERLAVEGKDYVYVDPRIGEPRARASRSVLLLE